MTQYFKSSKLINIPRTQEHPFHVLSSSRLPIVLATISGILALALVVKLHNLHLTELTSFSIIATVIFDPLFTIGELNSISTNLTILSLLGLLTTGM